MKTTKITLKHTFIYKRIQCMIGGVKKLVIKKIRFILHSTHQLEYQTTLSWKKSVPENKDSIIKLISESEELKE